MRILIGHKLSLPVRGLLLLNRFFPNRNTPPRVYDKDKLSDPHNPGSSIQNLEQSITYYDNLLKNSNVPLDGLVCLDCACGSGGGTISLAKQGARKVIGLDIAEHLLKTGARYLHDRCDAFLREKVELIEGDAKKLPFNDSYFDVIISSDTMEHVDDPSIVMNEIVRVLNEGGIARLSFPTYYAAFFSHLADHIKIPWHHLIFSEKTLKAACRYLIEHSNYQDTKIGQFEFEDAFSMGLGLNKLGYNEFKKILLKLENVEIIKFRASNSSRLFQPLVYIPFINKYFFDGLTCILRKKKASNITRSDLRRMKLLELQHDFHRAVSLFRLKVGLNEL